MITILSNKTAAQALERLAKIPPDAKPKWGAFKGNDVVPHLIGAFQYSMGRLDADIQDVSNFFSRRVAGHLMFSGILRIPKNVKFKTGDGQVTPPIMAPGDIGTLNDTMEEFFAGADGGEFTLIRHPYFGELGYRGWRKFHAAHNEHHLRQFGA